MVMVNDGDHASVPRNGGAYYADASEAYRAVVRREGEQERRKEPL